MDMGGIDVNCISAEQLKVSQERWNRYMEMLTDAGYIKGVSIKKYVTGDIVINIDEIRIT